MRRISRLSILAATVLASGLAAGLPAATSVSAGPSADVAEQRVQRLRLACGPRTTDSSVAVHCRWSAPASPAAAGVRLWRLAAGDDQRRVVFSSDDPTLTSYTDADVRRQHRYTYAVQVLDAGGRVLAQSGPVTVFVPGAGDRTVELLRLECVLGPQHEAIVCEWSHPQTASAEIVELWRSVDGQARELVERFRPDGETTYRDRVPDGAARIAYAVLAKDAGGRLVARSRADLVRIPAADPVVTIAEPVPAPPADPPPATVPPVPVPPETVPSETVPPVTVPPVALDARPLDTAPPATLAVRSRERVAP